MPWPLVGVVSTRWLLASRGGAGARGALVLLPLALGALCLMVLPPAAGAAALALGGLGAVVLAAGLYLAPAAAVAVLGLALACASLSTVLAVSRGVQHAIVQTLARVNGHLLVTKYGLDFREYEQVAEALRATPGVRAVSPFAYAPVAIVALGPKEGKGGPAQGAPTGEASVAASRDPEEGAPVMALGKGIDPRQAAHFEGLAELLGHGDLAALRPGDSRHVPGVVLGRRLAQRLGVGEGERVRLVVPREIRGAGAPAGPPRFAEFEVLDLVRTGTGAVDDHLALMHLSAAQALFFAERRVTGVEAQLDDPARAPELARAVEAALPDTFRATPWQRTHAGFLRSARQVTAAVGVVVGMLVWVSAGLVLSAVLLALRRRRGQLAVLRALGADGRAVVWLVAAVGGWMGLLGAAAGAALATLWARALGHAGLSLDPSVYPVDALRVELGARELLVPGLAAVLAAILASAPVALAAARRRVLGDLEE